MKKKLNTWLLVLNVVLLGIGPVFILILLGIKGNTFLIVPWWAGGIFLSWAMTINLWGGLGFLFDQKYPAIYSKFFIVTNLFLPLGMSLALHNSLWLTLYEITTFHFLSLVLAITILMLFGPFLNFSEEKTFLGAMVWVVFGLMIFGYFLTLPAIWCEFVLWENLNTIWTNTTLQLGLRYWGVILNSYVLLQLLYWGSIYV